jgi:hypothetical protein
VNSSVNLIQEVKTILPVFIPCLTIHLANVAVCLLLQHDRAQWICVWLSGKSDPVSNV